MVWRASVELLLPTAAGRPPAMAADLVGMIRGVIESIRASCPEVPICARLDPSEPKRFRLRPGTPAPRRSRRVALASPGVIAIQELCASSTIPKPHRGWMVSQATARSSIGTTATRANTPSTASNRPRSRPCFVTLCSSPAGSSNRLIPSPRWLVLGMTNAGRHLALIFTRRGDTLRPISGRPMRRKEGAAYEEACRQDQAPAGSPKR